MNDKVNTIVIGSSGYVASDLVPQLKKFGKTFGIDLSESNYTDYVANIDGPEISLHLQELSNNELIVINLAAARFDFGLAADEYYKLNVECHANFLKTLSNLDVKKFIHVSSGAALDGRNIPYSRDLNCDDAYRATKFLQEDIIEKWCFEHNVELIVLYPSAIFSDDPRSDTNIGKLQLISKYIPFIPKINVIKSLTYLPNFSKFIIDSTSNKIPAGKYLTIEKPSLTVSRIIQIISGRSVKLFPIPFLSIILKTIAYVLYVLGLFGRIDLKLTPNRVVKLYTDTSYSNIKFDDIDTYTYALRNHKELPEILAKFKKGN